MIIYSAEKDVAHLINDPKNRVLACASPAILATDKVKSISSKQVEIALATNKNQFDLYYLYSILATVGWNKNDDIFDRSEIWAARFTPEDKPFNFRHDPQRVIGHVTGSAVVDEEYNIIDNDAVFDDLPQKFHILTSAVIYRNIASKVEGLEAETASIIEDINSGKLFVSMECLFSDFDYGITSASTGEQKIIKRDKDSAFLTKYLGVYLGEGKYNGDKIGRVLRNLTFSGKGLVEKPANPESYIINDPPKAFYGTLASLKKIEEIDMADDKTVSLDKFNDSQKEIADLRARLVAVGEENLKKEIDGLKADLVKSGERVKALELEVTNVSASKKEVEKDVVAAKAEVEAISKKLEEATKEVAGIKLASTKASRVSTLVDKGVEKAEAEKIVEKFAGLNEELFAEIVATQASLVEAKKATPATAEADKAKAEAAKVAAAAAALKTVTPVEEPNLAVADEQVVQSMAGLSEYLGGMIKVKAKK